MSVFDKLKFWKREDDFDFDKLTDKEMGAGKEDLFKGEDLGLEQKSAELEEKPMFPEEQQPAAQPQQQFTEPGLQPPPGGLQQMQQQQAMATAPAPAGTKERDTELLSSKLDTIKALLNSLDQRIANLEKAAGVEKKQEKLW